MIDTGEQWFKLRSLKKEWRKQAKAHYGEFLYIIHDGCIGFVKIKVHNASIKAAEMLSAVARINGFESVVVKKSSDMSGAANSRVDVILKVIRKTIKKSKKNGRYELTRRHS